MFVNLLNLQEMLITKKSILTGLTRTLDINVTQEQLDKHNQGELAQNVFSHLSPTDREFIMTGVTADEWDDLFKENDE